MSKQKEFEKALHDFQWRMAELSGVTMDVFKQGYQLADHPDASGHALDTPLKPIRDCLDNVADAFDELQQAIGTPPDDHRTYHTRTHQKPIPRR